MRNQQYAALPYRFRADGHLEVLLVTSLRTRRWIIPKGWPIKGLKPPKAAAQEAFEEAGILGKVGNRPVGCFAYSKLKEKTLRAIECEVIVFPLRVERQLAVWPEINRREVRWLPAEEASRLVGDDGLRQVIDGAVDKVPR